MAVIPKGSEPENIRKRMDNLFAKLDGAYPDKVISGLRKGHKHWAEAAKEFSVALGYPDSESFLESYGYTVRRARSGRPRTNNYDEVIAQLRRRYPGGVPESFRDIAEANPDLKAVLKTMQNQASDLYGMGLNAYFHQIGLYEPVGKQHQLDKLIDQLKARYRRGVPKPSTLAKLMEENPDLPMDRLAYIPEVYASEAEPFLLVMGILGTGYEAPAATAAPPKRQRRPKISGDTEEERWEAWLKLLAQRYAEKTTLPATLTALAAENRDVPVNKLNKYIRSQGEQKIERWYIRNRILQGKDTDLQEYTYCMVSFEKTAWDAGSKQYAYLAGSQEYAPGDWVVVEFGFSGPEIGEVKEVIRCLGIDAPWPVAATKEILRRALPEEVAAGLPIITARDQETILMRRNAKPSRSSPKKDWSDDFPQQSGGTVSGFVPADQEHFRRETEVDLRKNSSSRFESNWVPCEFRFRGFAAEVAKLKRYAMQNNIHISWDGAVTEEVRELWVIAEEKTMDLIEKFPALKATGLAEEWWLQEVHVMYSESGFAGITHTEFGGYFDRRQESRWEWEYDMMEPINERFYWLQTGDLQQVFYRYPYAGLWNDNAYTRELDGLIYIRDTGNGDG